MDATASASCPICRNVSTSVFVPPNVVGPCAVFGCRPCHVRYLGAWTRGSPEEDDYWADEETGVAIYTAPEVEAELAAKYASALDAFASDIEPGARVLDVGCGVGTFLGLARDRGYSATGVDISPVAARTARERFGHDARSGTLADQRFPDASFDVVTLWDVIEHVFDPGELLGEVRRVLRPGGRVLLETPDEGALLRVGARALFRMTLGRMRAVTSCYYPAHRIYFTRRGLARLLVGTGFGTPLFRRERSVRSKSRLKNATYAASGQARLADVAFALMRVAPFLGNKIVASAGRSADAAA
jgi:SAM-dependent methyltransferase